MRSTALGLAVLLGIILAGFTPRAYAQGEDCEDCQACQIDGHVRAGYPHCMFRWALPTDTPHYSACYIGGGSACRGEPRCVDEGVWGRDYSGILFPKRIWLSWSHGRRYQGGAGAYKPDGPKFLHHEE